MVMERNPIPNRQQPTPDYSAIQCSGCGSRQDTLKADGSIVCAYCRATKGWWGADMGKVDVTCMDDDGPVFIEQPTQCMR